LSRSVLLSCKPNLFAANAPCQGHANRGDSRFQISNLRSQIKNPDLRYEICNLPFCAKRRLLPAFVLGEVVVDGRIALEAPNRALFTPLAVENRLQKRRDLLPGDLGL
jgi:hypothetical protein